MKVTINKFRIKQMPSKFGGTWDIIDCKFNETGDDVYQLSGFGSKFTEKLKVGYQLSGYPSVRQWQGQNGIQTTKTFNKITAEYVYDLLLKLSPDVETGLTETPKVEPDSGWVSTPADDNEDTTF